MSEEPHPPTDPADPTTPAKPEYTPQQARYSLMARRRQRIIDQIERNRRGEYTVPTWVLTVALALLIAGIAALIIWA
jgi:hypothetical protein